MERSLVNFSADTITSAHAFTSEKIAMGHATLYSNSASKIDDYYSIVWSSLKKEDDPREDIIKLGDHLRSLPSAEQELLLNRIYETHPVTNRAKS